MQPLPMHSMPSSEDDTVMFIAAVTVTIASVCVESMVPYIPTEARTLSTSSVLPVASRVLVLSTSASSPACTDKVKDVVMPPMSSCPSTSISISHPMHFMWQVETMVRDDFFESSTDTATVGHASSELCSLMLVVPVTSPEREASWLRISTTAP